MNKQLLWVFAVVLSSACGNTASRNESDAASDVESQSASVNGASKRVLVVLSGADSVRTREGNAHPTGYFLSELAGPAIALEGAGYHLTFATPAGEAPTMDRVSDDDKWFETPDAHRAALAFVNGEKALASPSVLEEFSDTTLDRFAAVFVPGGHAPLEDLWRSEAMAQVLKHFHARKKTTALVCHGPAALLSATSDAGWIYAGYRMTGFSTAEERQEEDAGHLDGHMPYYLDAALSALGANVSVAAPWSSYVVRDRELITGQNPMSEKAFTDALLHALAGRE